MEVETGSGAVEDKGMEDLVDAILDGISVVVRDVEGRVVVEDTTGGMDGTAEATAAAIAAFVTCSSSQALLLSCSMTCDDCCFMVRMRSVNSSASLRSAKTRSWSSVGSEMFLSVEYSKPPPGF